MNYKDLYIKSIDIQVTDIYKRLEYIEYLLSQLNKDIDNIKDNEMYTLYTTMNDIHQISQRCEKMIHDALEE